MIKYLVDTKETRNITLLYSAKTSRDFAYRDVFEQARRELNIKTVYFITGQEAVIGDQNVIAGRITKESIKQQVPDYQERMFYISGTQSMVKSMQKTLADLGIHRHQIKVDYFSGYTS
jgi:ferredoxin-NADP reductase